MLLGFCSSAYPGLPLPQLFDKLAAAGYQTVEVFTWEGHPCHPAIFHAAQAEATRRAAATCGLQISAVSAHTTWVTPGGSAEAALEFTCRSAQVAEMLEAPLLITSTGPFPPACDRFQAWDALRAALLQAAHYAESLGVTLCLEPHIGHICLTWESTLKLLREIGHPNLRLNFDASHFFLLGLDHELALDQLRDYLSYVHLKDYVMGRAPLGNLTEIAGNATPVALGEGDFPLANHLNHLRHLNYDGVVSAELYLPDPDSALRRSAENLLPLLQSYSRR
ncbi:MAG: sugar phosphate isomerase/epimerase family protein [Candidatus Zipacnadales bacterium]